MTIQLGISPGKLSSHPRIVHCISRTGDYKACMKDNNANGPESLIDMKTPKFSVVCHLYDDDQKSFFLMRFYLRYITGSHFRFADLTMSELSNNSKC